MYSQVRDSSADELGSAKWWIFSFCSCTAKVSGMTPRLPSTLPSYPLWDSQRAVRQSTSGALVRIVLSTLSTLFTSETGGWIHADGGDRVSIFDGVPSEGT